MKKFKQSYFLIGTKKCLFLVSFRFLIRVWNKNDIEKQKKWRKIEIFAASLFYWESFLFVENIIILEILEIKKNTNNNQMKWTISHSLFLWKSRKLYFD